MAERQQKGERTFRGIAVSAGICRGKILVLHRTRHVIARRELADNEIAGEVSRFEQALVQTRQQILEVQRKVLKELSATEADIFDAHLLMLEDQVLVDEVIRLIRGSKGQRRLRLSHRGRALHRRRWLGANDEYLRERATDMRDLTARVLDNLLEVKDQFDLHHLAEPCILVSHDLSPSTTAQLDKKFVLGFATDIGGKTSHTAIMARSLGIPAVVGLQTISQELESGDYALLDGYNGIVIVNPTDQTLFEYGQLGEASRRRSRKNCTKSSTSPPSPSTAKPSIFPPTSKHQNDIDAVLAHGAEGVGLFRTEFLFINRDKSADRGGAIPGLSRGGRRVETASRSSSARSIWAATNSPRTCNWRRRSIRFSAGARSGSASRSRNCSAPSCAPFSAPAPRAT